MAYHFEDPLLRDIMESRGALIAPVSKEEETAEVPPEAPEASGFLRDLPRAMEEDQRRRIFEELMRTPEQRFRDMMDQYRERMYGIKPGSKPGFWRNLFGAFVEGMRSAGMGSQYVPPDRELWERAVKEYQTVAPSLSRELATDVQAQKAAAQAAYQQQSLGLRAQDIQLRHQDRAAALALKQGLLDIQKKMSEGKLDMMEAQKQWLLMQTYLKSRVPSGNIVGMAAWLAYDPDTGEIDRNEFMQLLGTMNKLTEKEKSPNIRSHFDTGYVYDASEDKFREVPAVWTFDPASGQVNRRIGADLGPHEYVLDRKTFEQLKDFSASAEQSKAGIQLLRSAASEGRLNQLFGILRGNPLVIFSKKTLDENQGLDFMRIAIRITDTNAAALHSRGLLRSRPAQRLVEEMKETIAGKPYYNPRTLLRTLLANVFLVDLAKLRSAGIISAGEIDDPGLIYSIWKRYEELVNEMIEVNAAAEKAAKSGVPARMTLSPIPSVYEILLEYRRNRAPEGTRPDRNENLELLRQYYQQMQGGR